jgi:hypothetical protein
MQNSNTTSNPVHMMENLLTDLVHKGESYVRPQWERVEDQIRQSPTKAVLVAAGLGYFLHRLPAGSLLGSTLKLAWALAPPAIMAALVGKGFLVLEDKLHSSEAASKSKALSRRNAPEPVTL